MAPFSERRLNCGIFHEWSAAGEQVVLKKTSERQGEDEQFKNRPMARLGSGGVMERAIQQPKKNFLSPPTAGIALVACCNDGTGRLFLAPTSSLFMLSGCRRCRRRCSRSRFSSCRAIRERSEHRQSLPVSSDCSGIPLGS